MAGIWAPRLNGTWPSIAQKNAMPKDYMPTGGPGPLLRIRYGARKSALPRNHVAFGDRLEASGLRDSEARQASAYQLTVAHGRSAVCQPTMRIAVKAKNAVNMTS
jgi:hypothetical protein